MENLIYIFGIGFWILFGLLITCVICVTYIKWIYFKWDKDDREWERFVNISKHVNSE